MILQKRHAGMDLFLRSETVAPARLRSARDRRSRDALEVATKADHCEAVRRRDQLFDRVALTESDLEYECAGGLQADRRLLHEAADHIEAVSPGKKRERRFVIAHLG